MPVIDFRAAAVLAIASIAAVHDVRSGRIPNLLTFGGAVMAFAYALTTGGLSSLGFAAAGWLAGAALFFPFFALGGMGAGDVKLLAALAAWFGPGDAIWLAMFAAMAGGLVGVGVAVAHGYLRQALSNIWMMLSHWRVFGFQAIAGLTLTDTGAPRLAYAIPIMIGAVCTLWRG